MIYSGGAVRNVSPNESYLFLVGPFSAIQPPIDSNFFLLLGYIRKLAIGSPLGNYFTPGLVYSQHMAPKNIKLAQTPLRVPIFLCPGKLTSG